MIRIDASAIVRLGEDLARLDLASTLSDPVEAAAAAAVEGMARDFVASGSFSAAVSYDLTSSDGSVKAEAGPEASGAGLLENIAYFGGVNGGGGTVPDPERWLEEVTPDLEKGVLDALEELL